MDPNSGEILAMDTTTRYNLNDPYNLSTYYTDEEIQAMDEKAKSEAWYKMWRNFCVSDSYEPGSPQKAFTVAGAIEEGAISGNEVFECGGKLHFGDWDIRCVARAGHGPLTITQGYHWREKRSLSSIRRFSDLARRRVSTFRARRQV